MTSELIDEIVEHRRFIEAIGYIENIEIVHNDIHFKIDGYVTIEKLKSAFRSFGYGY